MAKFWGWRTLHLRVDIEAETEKEAESMLEDMSDDELECIDVDYGVVERGA